MKDLQSVDLFHSSSGVLVFQEGNSNHDDINHFL